MCLTAFRVLITAPTNTLYMLQLWYRPKEPATEIDEADELDVVDEVVKADVVEEADEAEKADEMT